MLKKSRKILAIMCCLMLTLTSVAFADTEREEKISIDSALSEIPVSSKLSGYTYTYENAPQEIKDIYAAKCIALNIIPKADDEIFIPKNVNLMSNGESAGVYTNYSVYYDKNNKTIRISGSKNYTISTTKVVGYGYITRGNEVHCAQVILGLLGYNLFVDSVFGSDTYDSVVTFQRRNNISADGIIGSTTWDRLGSQA